MKRDDAALFFTAAHMIRLVTCRLPFKVYQLA